MDLGESVSCAACFGGSPTRDRQGDGRMEQPSGPFVGNAYQRTSPPSKGMCDCYDVESDELSEATEEAEPAPQLVPLQLVRKRK